MKYDFLRVDSDPWSNAVNHRKEKGVGMLFSPRRGSGRGLPRTCGSAHVGAAEHLRWQGTSEP